MRRSISTGDLIELNADPSGVEFQPIEARVIDLLSVQFTAAYTEGDKERVTFKFYADEGAEWRKK